MSDVRDIAVIIVAGGSSSRFGTDKLLQLLENKPILRWSIDAFTNRSDVDQVIVVGGEKYANHLPKDVEIAASGKCRAESVLNGLQMVSAGTLVAIHDAARPLVSDALIQRVVESAREFGAAGPAIAVKDTIRPVDAQSRFGSTLDRAVLRAMQTPQVIRTDWLRKAFDSCPVALDAITDDLQLIELAGRTSMCVEGDERNLKITRPLDLELARLLVRQ